jgi:hypothetical protein
MFYSFFPTAKIVLNLVNAYIFKHLSDDLDYVPEDHFPPPLFSIVPIMPVSLLSIAAILNLNNWTFYYFKIGEMASHVDVRAIEYGDPGSLKRRRLILNMVTLVAILTIVSFVVGISYKSVNENEK